MQNFFALKEQFAGNHVILTGDEYRHATRACRVRTGEAIHVTDGMGRRVEATIEAIDFSTLRATIVRDISGKGEPPIELTAALSIIKPSLFELAVEKCTELGVRRFMPIIAARCETDAGKLKSDRLARIALEAAKQSGRSWLPIIECPISLQDVVVRIEGDMIVALASAEETMSQAVRKMHPQEKLTILVGPEGDFTDGERELIIAGGAVPANLGGLVLRAETAMIAAVTRCVGAVTERQGRG